MNCWIWIILLWCFCGNGSCQGGCQNGCGCNDRRGCMPSPCGDLPPVRENPGCGCDEPIQPRGFAGFGDSATCGCEEKESRQG